MALEYLARYHNQNDLFKGKRMTWGTAFNYTKSIVGNKLGIENSQNSNVDFKAPIGARIGSLIKIKLSAFTRSIVTGGLSIQPLESEMLVVAISRLHFDDSNANVYRLYLNVGDNDTCEKFLQIMMNDDDTPKEILYCSTLVRFVPETTDDQEAFTGRAGYGLGEGHYEIWQDQLSDSEVTESQISAAFGSNESLKFNRDTGDDLTVFQTPFHGNETRIDDNQGEHGLTQEVYYMPYVRALGETDTMEYLLIATEVVESRDGDDNNREIHVDFMIGLTVTMDNILIQ